MIVIVENKTAMLYEAEFEVSSQLSYGRFMTKTYAKVSSYTNCKNIDHA